MSDATAPLEIRPHTSLFTRLRIVEAELEELKALFADLKEDHEALREDRDEWRWRAEYLRSGRRSVTLMNRPSDPTETEATGLEARS